MGPRPDGRGTYISEYSLVQNSGLQWGRDRMAAERPAMFPEKLPAWLLQWGRDRMAAERCFWARLAQAAPQASMGPRPDGRGTPPAARARDRDELCFNGAATGWPRNASGTVLPSESTTGFNGAATGWPRNAAWPRPARSAATSFNGAATGWPRNVGAVCVVRALAALQWGRDRMAAERMSSTTLDGFGGMLQWGRDRMAAERRWHFEPPR